MEPPQSDRSLILIFSEIVSEWIAKGEVIDRYLNPGDLFGELHVVLTNRDELDPEAVRRLAGRAKVTVHNFPLPRRSMIRTAGWRPQLLKRWAGPIVDLAEQVRPSLVRTHGARHNALAASEIKRRLGIPYVVSLHVNPDADVRGRKLPWAERVQEEAIRGVQRYTLRRADLVLPVYEPIVPYLERLGVTRYEVAYNVINVSSLREKDDYALADPARIVSVGRQFEAKNPEQLIRAVASMPDARLTLIGGGPLNAHLRQLAASLEGGERIEFHTALSNDEVCARLAASDVFATHTEYWEISKAVLEALLTGLPVVLNERSGPPVPELAGGLCVVTDDTPEAWRATLEELLGDHEHRERLGRNAREHARSRWHPEQTEARFVELYERVMAGAAPRRSATGSAPGAASA